MWQKAPIPEWIDEPERMLQLCREIKDIGIAGLDTETTGKDNWMKDFVLFWSLSTGEGNRYCLSKRMLDIFDQELADDPSITWAMTNANFDRCMLANSGVRRLAGTVHCTLVMDWLHNENRTGRHGLKQTAFDHLGLNMGEFKKVFKKQKGETYQDTLIRMMREEPNVAIDYASMDAWASLRVYKFLRKNLQNEGTTTGLTLWDLYEKIEAPYSEVLYNNMRNGIMVDKGWLTQIRVPIVAKMEECLFKFNKIAGEEVNLNSPKQLVELFIGKLGKEPIKWTSGGKSGNRQPSVDESVLAVWAARGDEPAKLLMQYRGLSKTLGTYVDGLIGHIWVDGRVHPILNQHITVTGRLSSSNPNLQNIPRYDDDVWGLRGAFMPDTGMTLVAIDYKQLEMRLLAHISGDKNMQSVINRGWDIHAGTASLMYGVPYEEIQEAKYLKSWLEEDHVSKDKWPEWISRYVSHRFDAKAVGFGINYGEGDRALSEKLGVTLQEAKVRRAKYFEPYPQVEEYIRYTHESCRENLEVSNILGYKRRLLEANMGWKKGFYSKRDKKFVPERPGPLAARALRQDVNFEVQGLAAVVAKLAQLQCEPTVLHKMGLSSHMSKTIERLGIKQLLQVHDEVIFEVPTDSLHEGIDALVKTMEKPFRFIPDILGLPFDELSIPLDVDAGYGESWSEAH